LDKNSATQPSAQNMNITWVHNACKTRLGGSRDADPNIRAVQHRFIEVKCACEVSKGTHRQGCKHIRFGAIGPVLQTFSSFHYNTWGQSFATRVHKLPLDAIPQRIHLQQRCTPVGRTLSLSQLVGAQTAHHAAQIMSNVYLRSCAAKGKECMIMRNREPVVGIGRQQLASSWQPPSPLHIHLPAGLL
jgi:hypothetical protein